MTDKEKKLLERPVESDTKIIANAMLDFGDFKALYEKWVWDGVMASSVICLKEDVQDRSQQELIEFLFTTMKLPIDPQATYKVSGDYIFLNFGFSLV